MKFGTLTRFFGPSTNFIENDSDRLTPHPTPPREKIFSNRICLVIVFQHCTEKLWIEWGNFSNLLHFIGVPMETESVSSKKDFLFKTSK